MRIIIYITFSACLLGIAPADSATGAPKLVNFGFTARLFEFAQQAETDSMGHQMAAGFAKRQVRHVLSDFWQITTSPLRFELGDWLMVGSALAVSGAIYTFDEDIAVGIERNRRDPTYRFFADIGHDVESMGIIPHMDVACLSGYALGSLLHVEPMKQASVEIFESLLIAATYKNIFRDLVGRYRPRNDRGSHSFKPFSGKSFPSGHTSNAFQVAAIISHQADFLPVSIAIYSLAGLVGLQRLDDRAHWMSDIFVGAVYGIVVARTIIKLNEKRHLQINPAYNSLSGQTDVGLSMTF